MPIPPTNQTNDIQRVVLASLIIAGVGVGIFFLTRRPAQAPTVNSTANRTIAAVTPQSYTMISGTIATIDTADKKLVVDFPIITATGANQVKPYAVSIGPATLIQTVNQAVAPVEVATIDLAQLAVGDRIDAVGNENLAQLDAFTAVTILKFIP